MKWLKKLELLDYGVFIKKEKTLVISDLQLGYEQYLQKKGIIIPKNQFSKILERLDEMIKKTTPEKLIIAGDVQHDFQKLDFETLTSVQKLVKHAEKKTGKIVFVKGNHDTMLETPLEKIGYKLFQEHKTEDFLIIHGHEKTSTEKTIIMGHEHPAISLKDEFGQKHKYKCHLLGKKMLIIPSISILASGTVVNEESKPLSPMLENYDELTPIIQGLKFPKIKQLKKIA